MSAVNFDALIIPGRFLTDLLRDNGRIIAFTKSFMDEMKPVCANCITPQLLITAKVLDGRDTRGYKSINVNRNMLGQSSMTRKCLFVRNNVS